MHALPTQSKDEYRLIDGIFVRRICHKDQEDYKVKMAGLEQVVKSFKQKVAHLRQVYITSHEHVWEICSVTAHYGVIVSSMRTASLLTSPNHPRFIAKWQELEDLTVRP